MTVNILVGDCVEQMKFLPDGSAQTCVTSPPYFGLRDYGVDGQIGLEPTPDEFVASLVTVFREVRRVLRDDGTLWLNLGDSYSTESKWGGSTGGKAAAGLHGANGGGRTKARHGIPDKNLLGIPWRVAFALQADGWHLRQDIIWSKPNPMPESVRDRCTKAHEYIFLLSKGPRYYFDHEAIKEPAVTKPGPSREERKAAGATRGNVAFGENVGAGTQRGVHGEGVSHNLGAADGKRNRRSVWTVATKPFKGAHFATFPPDLIEPCILAGSRLGDTVLDPFGGAGTTGLVAQQHGRDAILAELNPEYAEIARRRIGNEAFVL